MTIRHVHDLPKIHWGPPCQWQTNLLVYIQLPEDFCGVEQVLILKDPTAQLL